jgi:hypothetical protein
MQVLWFHNAVISLAYLCKIQIISFKFCIWGNKYPDCALTYKALALEDRNVYQSAYCLALGTL